MSMRKCATIKCPHHVREGLRRFGSGVDGQELADGRFCWRCRARHAMEDRRDARRRTPKQRKAAGGLSLDEAERRYKNMVLDYDAEHDFS